jgi:predicted nucleotidyltransferase
VQTLTFDLNTLTGVCRHKAIRLLVAFGSVARGQHRPDSDLDLAVWLEAADVTPLALVTLDTALQPLFPGQHLDLVLLNSASPLLQFQVARQGLPLFEATPGVFQAFQVLAAKRYADTAHLRQLDRVEETARHG